MTKDRSVDWFQELMYLVKFGLVGLFNTILCAGVMWLFSLTGMTYPVYSALGYAVGIVVSFVLNFRFTFKPESGNLVPYMVKFLIVCLTMVLVAEGVQHLLIANLGLPELLGVAGGMVAYTGGGFLLNRFWVFRKKAAAPPA